MYNEEYEDLIRIEAEGLAEELLGVSYYDLSPELKKWVRIRAIESLWSEYQQQETAAA